MKNTLLRTITVLLLVHGHLPAANEMRIADTVKGGTVTGGSVTGGSVTGGSVTGGSVTGGSVTGGNVTGGNVTGGSVTGGSAQRGKVRAGTVTASAEGREIRVTAGGAVSVNVNGATAEVRLGGQTLLVEKTKLVLDGQMLGEVPQNTRKIEVQVDEKDMLSVKGDGKELARAKMQQP